MSAVKGILKGLGTTWRLLWERKHTVPYPERRRVRSERFRGRHELRRYANGMEMCVGCELCQVACPANAITVYAAQNDPARPHSPGERYAFRYEIDLRIEERVLVARVLTRIPVYRVVAKDVVVKVTFGTARLGDGAGAGADATTALALFERVEIVAPT